MSENKTPNLQELDDDFEQGKPLISGRQGQVEGT